jgi:hypothetical protein
MIDEATVRAPEDQRTVGRTRKVATKSEPKPAAKKAA